MPRVKSYPLSLLISLLLLPLLPGSVSAWSSQGHQIVGAIADQLIAGSNTERRVHELLNPGETLASVSTWMDCVKGDCGVVTDEMRAFREANPQHREYHFTNVPVSVDAYDSGAIGTAAHDVVHVLQAAIAVLRHDAAAVSFGTRPWTEREALLVLVHCLGDLHQPLHVVTAYLSSDDRITLPTSDERRKEGKVISSRGGNSFIVNGKPLHQLWDADFVRYAMRRVQARTPESFAHDLIERYPSEGVPSSDVMEWPIQWANETLHLGQEAYMGLRFGPRSLSAGGRTEWPTELPRGYVPLATLVAEGQLARGGHHLAELLQQVFPNLP